jgi:hypothetical protein
MNALDNFTVPREVNIVSGDHASSRLVALHVPPIACSPPPASGFIQVAQPVHIRAKLTNVTYDSQGGEVITQS